ncbi:spermidine/putrescine ABC transporter ATP-binding protein [Skermanella aerolata]|uniref:Spermidine/putrescine ABC transporter ATP-binding protein n=1 Tax=Skermanella aerolata TaxID=393310 RepID=A0A512DXA7_9PROT|nr:ABC transporter ATP-binding protein [Skermanella aerolata]KJB95537.1 ABC transporter ATP-binding protein [Skermanella aerolata KACC 11604]GEO40820.1 spermidine/putrescine ABC transporter ATP-binding protein [Skermanella aerolata]
MSQDIELDHVTMRFGALTAVSDVHLTIPAGEFFSFLGPSGCGKTTILRMISGFMEPTSGVIRIGGEDMSGIGPNKRPTALIFQNLALFPLMTVAENIGFGLEVRGIASADRRRRVKELLDLVALPDTADKKVTELSGGQRQRIAIARALAVEPAVLLLDEPLSALDLKLRQHMRSELRDIQKRTGVTFIYITHDQGEALTMSDRIGVMSRGVLCQVGDGRSIYDDPASAFVASFVGETNRFTGRVIAAAGGRAAIDTPAGKMVGRNPRDLREGDEAILFVRPERMVPADGAADHNIVESPVSHQEFEGAFVNVFLEPVQGRTIVVQTTNAGTSNSNGAGNPWQPGATTRITFRPEDAVVLPQSEDVS